jgi:hypothetical protein
VDSHSLALYSKLESEYLFSGLKLETEEWTVFSDLTHRTGALTAILSPYTRNWNVDSYSLA